MGPGTEASAGYSLLYRSFDHQNMKTICLDLDVSTLKDRLKRQLRRDSVSQDMRAFANAFANLQEQRHLADYDPTYEFQPSDVVSLMDTANVAIAAFDRAAPDEQADVLALMMVRGRA